MASAAVLVFFSGSQTAAAAQQAAPAKGDEAGKKALERAFEEKEKAALDCSDFATLRAAQATMESPFSSEGDRFGLDEDGDGKACEAQAGGAAEDGTRLGDDTGGDRDCADFASQKAAQDHLRVDPSDPDNLDPDANGLACEVIFVPYADGAVDWTPVAAARSDADIDCEDFEYRQEAQQIYLRDKGDPHGLDSAKEDDGKSAGNGTACEKLPYMASNVEEVHAEGVGVEPATSTPLALIDAWPHGGGLGLLFDGAALLLVGSGALTLLAAYRERSRRSE